jgi:hypothetical protein
MRALELWFSSPAQNTDRNKTTAASGYIPVKKTDIFFPSFREFFSFNNFLSLLHFSVNVNVSF